jgi:RES domain-containing protein
LIFTDLPLGSVVYRGHDPRWAVAPTSGAGAAKAGGRFNRPGIEALYLSLDAMTALLEYQQTSALLPPCTICSYVVVLSGLVDLRKLHTGAPWDGLWQDWPEDWRHLAFDLKVEPPSWVLSDMVRGARSPGIIFPSMVNSGGVNLVLFPDLFGPGEQVDVQDDQGKLPVNQSSWPI